MKCFCKDPLDISIVILVWNSPCCQLPKVNPKKATNKYGVIERWQNRVSNPRPRASNLRVYLRDKVIMCERELELEKKIYRP